MPLFRHKPSGAVQEAFQVPERGDDNVGPLLDWAERVGLEYESGYDESFIIVHSPAEEDVEEVEPGGWIVMLGDQEFKGYSRYEFELFFEAYNV